MAMGRLRWLGHSFVEFTTADDKVIYIDPLDQGRRQPGLPPGPGRDRARRSGADKPRSFRPHGFPPWRFCNKTGAMLGGGVQTVGRLQEEGFDKDKVANFGMGYMVGGGVQLDWVKVIATQALHSSDTACAFGPHHPGHRRHHLVPRRRHRHFRRHGAFGRSLPHGRGLSAHRRRIHHGRVPGFPRRGPVKAQGGDANPLCIIPHRGGRRRGVRGP